MRKLIYGFLAGATAITFFDLGQRSIIRRERKMLSEGWSLHQDGDVLKWKRQPEPAVGRVDTKKLYATDDAKVWAEEFSKVAPGIDQSLMIGWFANAIETAKDVQWQRYQEEVLDAE